MTVSPPPFDLDAIAITVGGPGPSIRQSRSVWRTFATKLEDKAKSNPGEWISVALPAGSANGVKSVIKYAKRSKGVECYGRGVAGDAPSIHVKFTPTNTNNGSSAQ